MGIKHWQLPLPPEAGRILKKGGFFMQKGLFDLNYSNVYDGWSSSQLKKP
jgi:hypothetical protein